MGWREVLWLQKPAKKVVCVAPHPAHCHIAAGPKRLTLDVVGFEELLLDALPVGLDLLLVLLGLPNGQRAPGALPGSQRRSLGGPGGPCGHQVWLRPPLLPGCRPRPDLGRRLRAKLLAAAVWDPKQGRVVDAGLLLVSRSELLQVAEDVAAALGA